jgi:hypothetical protein
MTVLLDKIGDMVTFWESKDRPAYIIVDHLTFMDIKKEFGFTSYAVMTTDGGFSVFGLPVAVLKTKTRILEVR